MRYIQLPASFFAANRDRLTAQLAPNALAVLNANDVMPTNADGTMGFVQNSDLYYLTGVDQEETILVLFPGARDPKLRAVLFLRETNENIAIWEGAKLTKEQARVISGIENVKWLQEFDAVFAQLMFEAEQVYLNANEHLRADIQLQSRDSKFIERVRRQYPLHTLRRVAPLLYRQRMVKSPEEVEAVREATRATKAGFERVLKFVKPGVKEYEIEAELIHEYTRRRSRGFSYPPIIASGANACVLHYVENNATCQDGELLLMDVAAEYANYRSDMTRTIPVNGKFTPRQRAVYDAVLRALKECTELLKPGLTPEAWRKASGAVLERELIGLGLLDAEAVAAQNPEQPLYRKYFMHGIGHHIGIDVHDVNDPGVPFAPGNLVTVEPGIYIREEGLGIRLENLVLVGENGNENVMADVPLEADEIEAFMAS